MIFTEATSLPSYKVWTSLLRCLHDEIVCVCLVFVMPMPLTALTMITHCCHSVAQQPNTNQQQLTSQVTIYCTQPVLIMVFLWSLREEKKDEMLKTKNLFAFSSSPSLLLPKYLSSEKESRSQQHCTDWQRQNITFVLPWFLVSILDKILFFLTLKLEFMT